MQVACFNEADIFPQEFNLLLAEPPRRVILRLKRRTFYFHDGAGFGPGDVFPGRDLEISEGDIGKLEASATFLFSVLKTINFNA